MGTDQCQYHENWDNKRDKFKSCSTLNVDKRCHNNTFSLLQKFFLANPYFNTGYNLVNQFSTIKKNIFWNQIESFIYKVFGHAQNIKRDFESLKQSKIQVAHVQWSSA